MKFYQANLKVGLLHLAAAFVFVFSLNAKFFGQNTGEFSLDRSPLAAPTSPVMDYAGVLDPAAKAALEKRIIDFRDKTNPRVELAVAIVRTTGDRPIDMYSLAVARGWKIGSKEDDNPSALLFVAIDDRKYFTQISRDLEDELPDGLAGQLQRQYLVPAFKQSNYAKGVTDTIEAYIRTIEAKQSGVAPSPTPREKRERNQTQMSFCGFIICLIVVFVILGIISGRGGGGGNNRDRWRGGGFGGGRAGGDALPFIVGTILGSALGGGRSSGNSDWGGSSGGDSWGGFGGGGDFGGGGAGGDW